MVCPSSLLTWATLSRAMNEPGGASRTYLTQCTAKGEKRKKRKEEEKFKKNLEKYRGLHREDYHLVLLVLTAQWGE